MIEPGQMLVAPPAQKDSYWSQTAIFIYERSPHNTIGLIVNKPGDRPVSDLAKHNGLDYDGQEMLYIGGPVNSSALVLLHTNDWRSQNTFRVNEEFSVTSDKAMLPRICSGDRPSKWKLFLGMSAWASGQLECEIIGTHPWNKQSSWLTSSSDSMVLFDTEPARAWKRALNASVKEATETLFQTF